MSWKEEFIRRYGEEAYNKKLEQGRQWHRANSSSNRESTANWALRNPERVKEYSHERGRKGGKYYPKHLEYQTTGLQGERSKVRRKHAKRWQQYKDTIAPDSVIHHEWIPGTAEYDGVALVEANAHQHGIIDVIEVLDGEIKLLTEKEIKEQEVKNTGK